MGNLLSSEWNPAVSMRPPTTPSRSAMLTSGRTCMPTLSCLVAPPCTLVLLIVCKRRSLPWLPPPSRSRLSLPQKGNTLSGSEAPSWLLSQPSNRCGSPSRSMMSLAHPSCTGSASKAATLILPTAAIFPPAATFSRSSTVFYLITNHSNIQLAFLDINHSSRCVYFFFSQNFCQPPKTPPPPQNPSLVCQVNEHKRRDYLAS